MSPEAPSPPGARRLLVVDDDQDILVLLSRLLALEGYSVSTASRGAEALEEIRAVTPDIVLLDYMMPDMSGLQVLEEIKRDYPAVEVIIITGRGDEETATAFLKRGAADYIPKPFENRRVVAAVGSAVERILLERERRRTEARREKAHRRMKAERTGLRATVRRTAEELASQAAELGEANRLLRQANRQLREKTRLLSRLEKVYREIFDRAGDGILKVDPEGKITMANRMAGTILGAPNPEGAFLGSFLDAASGDRVRSLLSGMKSGRVMQEEADITVPADGGAKAVSLRAVPLLRDKVVHEVEIIMTDVSERLRQQDSLKKLEERSIVAGLSHHLSHLLLNSLVGAGGRLARARRLTAAGGREGLGRHLDMVGAELLRMEDVVRGYQDFVEMTKIEPSSLSPLAPLMERFFQALGRADDPEVERVLRAVRDRFTVPSPPPRCPRAVLLMDEPALLLGFAYLLRGAVYQALEAGFDRVEPTVACRRRGGNVMLSIFTPGARLAPRTMRTMLHPWSHQMLHSSFDDWGVTIANCVAERHRGELEVSDSGDGTSYLMRLPVAAHGAPEP